MKSRFIGIHSERILRFGYIYVTIRYENFHYSVIVDNMKEDCVLLEKQRKLQRVVHRTFRSRQGVHLDRLC